MRALAVIVAHPDDEAYAFGGTVRAWTRAGGRASILSLTRGEAAFDRAGLGRTGPALGAARERELSASAAALGAEATALSFVDGALVDDDRTAAAVRAWLTDRCPDVILTLGEDGAYGHVDHIACTALVGRVATSTVLHAAFEPGAFAAVHRALRRRAGAQLAIPDPRALGTTRADYAVNVSAHREAKLAALGAHVSQLADGDPRSFLGRGWIDARLSEERFVHAAGPAPADPFWREARCASST